MSHRIIIRLSITGAAPADNWATTIETSRHPALPVHLLVLQLPGRIRHPENCSRHLRGDDYELALELEGTTLPAELVNLSSHPAAEMSSNLSEVIPNRPAVVAILISKGRVSITIHQQRS